MDPITGPKKPSVDARPLFAGAGQTIRNVSPFGTTTAAYILSTVDAMSDNLREGRRRITTG